MERRGKTIRICKKFMRSWNVSSIDTPGKSDYICPECAKKEKEDRAA